MLASLNIVAFVPTKDATKARAFYEGVLGLKFVKDDGFAMVAGCERDYDPRGQGAGFHSGAVHDSRLAGFGYRESRD